MIINELDRRSFSDRASGMLDDPLSVETWPGIYYDQSGDDEATAFDALRVINELARQSAPEFEPIVLDLALGQLLADESRENWNDETDAVIPMSTQKVASFGAPSPVIRSDAASIPDSDRIHERDTSDEKSPLINEKHPAL